jgi:hypothetical protein
MLRISNAELRLVSHGYHFDDRGKKYVRVFSSLDFIKIQIKIQKHKEMHIQSISVDFPYTITNDWVEIIVAYHDIPRVGNPWMAIENYIDSRCKEVWFV